MIEPENNEIEKNAPKDIEIPLNHPEFIMAYKIDDNLFGKINFDKLISVDTSEIRL